MTLNTPSESSLGRVGRVAVVPAQADRGKVLVVSLLQFLHIHRFGGPGAALAAGSAAGRRLECVPAAVSDGVDDVPLAHEDDEDVNSLQHVDDVGHVPVV